MIRRHTIRFGMALAALAWLLVACSGGEQHDGGDDHNNLDVGELNVEAARTFMQRVAARDDRRHGLDPRALRYLREVDQDKGHADGGQHRREAEGMPQRPVSDAFYRPAVQCGDRHRDQKHDQQDDRHDGQAERHQHQEADQRDKTADHENVAVGEIDHADDAIDHGVADGDQAIDRAKHEAVDQLLGEIIHALPLVDAKRRGPPAAFDRRIQPFSNSGGRGRQQQVLRLKRLVQRLV